MAAPAYPIRERDAFLRDLHHFHEIRGTPFKRVPSIGNTEVDLYLLYTLVTAQGGWIKVNSKNTWDELLHELQIPKQCVNASVALKQIYLRYLDRWEKIHYLGEEADRGSEDDEENRHKKWSARVLHAVPQSYNYGQHIIQESNREYNHLSTVLYKPSDYDKLALSLISTLPNEQDFAINVCTLLSNDGKHTLKLDKHERILDYLLAHAGVFCHRSLRSLFIYCYNNVRNHPIHRFWNDVLENRNFLDLIDESKFSEKPKPLRINSGVDGVQTTCTESKDISGDVGPLMRTFSEKILTDISEIASESDSEYDDCEQTPIIRSSKNGQSKIRVRLKRKSCDSELFSLDKSMGTHDYIGQRVLQIATILRNLSFIDENVVVLSRSRTFIRFLLLCASSQWNNLRNLANDMLGNVATEIQIKDFTCDRLVEILLKVVTDGLRSEDRAVCLSSLEVLNKLSQNESNEDVLLRYLEIDVYQKVCSFLTVHDVMLLIYTLECLYALTSLGERSCNLIVNSHGVVATLVSLVTVEGKSYGPKACIGMKLVETLPGNTATVTTSSQCTANTPNAATSISTLSTTTAVTTTPSSSTSTIVTGALTSTVLTTCSPIINNYLSSPSVTIPTPVTAPTTRIVCTPMRPSVTMTPRALITSTSNTQPTVPSTATVTTTISALTTVISTSAAPSAVSVIQQTTTSQQLIEQQHAHQQSIHENEQFALAWLRATYEPSIGGLIDHQELYKHYLNSCSKIGRRGVISPLHFPRCVRSVFGGTVGPNPGKPPNSNESTQYYEGIKVRPQALVINFQTPSNIIPTLTTTPTAIPNSTVKRRNNTNKNKENSKRRNRTTPNTTTTTCTTTTTTITIPTIQTNTQCLSVIPTATLSTTTVPINNNNNNNNSPMLSHSLTVVADNNLSVDETPVSPASPILKAQLSAPPKQRTDQNASNKGDVKSQVMAHPHLSQALLGTVTTTSVSNHLNTTTCSTVNSKDAIPTNISTQSSTSLIKSLLATKVNDCMTTTMSMKSATESQNVVQVAARQQKLLAQQLASSANNTSSPPLVNCKNSNTKSSDIFKSSKINGVRQLFSDNEIADPVVSSTTQFTNNVILNKKDLIVSSQASQCQNHQPPPPPLAPLSNNSHKIKSATNKIENEDSDSTGNNSLTSSSGLGTIGIGGISSTDDGDNSLTSFEGLLNGIPAMENPLIEDSNSKDSMRLATNEISRNKPLRLADLLEQKVDNKSVPTLNGVLGKDIRLSDKSMDLVENHIEKALSRDNNTEIMSVENSCHNNNNNNEKCVVVDGMGNSDIGQKRPSSDDIVESDAKKPLLTSNFNGSVDSPAPSESISSSNGDESTTATVSTAAAKLFADIAADILEDEDEEQLLQEAQTDQRPPPPSVPPPPPPPPPLLMSNNNTTNTVQQIVVENGSQQVLLAQPRQIIVSQPQQSNLVATQSKPTATTQSVIVQNANQRQVVIQPPNAGQILLSSTLPGQVQIVPSSTQPGQYVLQTSGGPSTYMVAQPQTAVIHGQTQTVLVAQTAQQQGTPTKTIIILQQQQPTNNQQQQLQQQQQQKVMVAATQGGQPVVVTQVHRPILQTTTISVTTNGGGTTSTLTPSVIKQNPTVVTSVPLVTVPKPMVVVTPAEIPKKPPEECIVVKPIRDLTTPFVCEWDNCNVETKFKSANQVYLHACEAHCPIGSEEIICQWDRCDNMRRKRLSLMTHLHDKHCNTEAMKLSLVKRKQTAQNGTKSDPPQTTVNTPHPGYAPDAALHAIKRHALEFVNPKELQKTPTKSATSIVCVTPPRSGPLSSDQDDNEGPVTKSIRLTASLILRNLVIYSSNCRRYLKHYEPHLANVALSNVESSRTIAQVLYDLNEGSNHR